jgi:putative methionine-R-sulfoxide reductase with GAF domain
MISPHNNQKVTADSTNGRARRALILSLTLALLTTILSAVSYFNRIDTTELLPLPVISTGLTAIVAFIAVGLCWRGHVRVGMLLVIIVYNLTTPTYILPVKGIGLLIAYLVVVISIGMALPTLSVKDTRWVTILSIAVAIITILLDAFWPVSRPQIPTALSNVTYIATGIISLVIVIVGLLNFSNYSLNTKLISSTVIVAVVAVVAVAVLINNFTRTALTQEVGNNLVALANARALNVGELLARELSNLETLAVNNSLQEGVVARNATYADDEAAIQAQLLALDETWLTADDNDPLIQSVLNDELVAEMKEFQTISPQHIEIFITDRYGALIASTNRTSDYYQADEEWWLEAYGAGFGGTHIGIPEYDESTDTLAINVAVSMFDRNADWSGRISGVLRTTIRLDALSDILATATSEQTGETDLIFPNNTEALLDENGEIYLSQLSSEKLELSAQLQGSESEFTTGNFEGALSLISQANVNTLSHEPFIDFLGWQIVVHQTEEIALASVQEQQRFNILLGIGVVLLAGGAAAFVAQRIALPITKLTEVAVRVAEGDLSARAIVGTDDEVGVLAKAFNDMTVQLQEVVNSLEQRVAARTRVIATSAEVGRRLSTILDQQQLVKEVVEQIQTAFSYYHAHIYLADEDEGKLMMVGGTGDAGQRMLAQKHAIHWGQGLVGQAAETNHVVLVPDVSRADGWLANPLLSETKAEIAVPIAIGEQVLGVLDVQHNVVNGLQQEDADLLLSVANQVAIALQNARRYEAAQKQAAQVARMNTIAQKIQATTSVESALQVAVRELGQAASSNWTSVRLLADEPENGES